jgi:hypothetical protein
LVEREDLTEALKELTSSWPIVEEKTDLFHWSEALNRFDVLLEALLVQCIPPGKLQILSFTSEQHALVCAILDFCRVLLETCSSRNIFNSYDVRRNDFRFCLTSCFRDLMLC